MKKILISVFVIVSTFLIMSMSVHSIPLDKLGEFRSYESVGAFYSEGGIQRIRILHFQFGMIIRGFGSDIYYFYGQEDLPYMAKRNIESFANNMDITAKDGVDVYVYEANGIVNPNRAKHMNMKENSCNILQNLDFSLERGVLYIVIFRDKGGKMLGVRKIMISE